MKLFHDAWKSDIILRMYSVPGSDVTLELLKDNMGNRKVKQ